MRVVFVNLWWSPADPTRSGIGRALAARGHEVIVVQARADAVPEDGLRWICPPEPGWVRRLEALAVWAGDRAPVLHVPYLHLVPIVRALAPDVIHSFDLAARPTLWALGRVGAPLVVHDHGGAPTRHGWWRGVERAAIRGVDAVLMATPERAEGWVPAEKVHWCPETSTEIVAGSPMPGLGGAPRVLCVGRLDPVKDPMTVLDGFARFAAAHPSARLVMAWGSGVLESMVRGRVAADPALRERVTMLGPVPADQMASLYAASDVLVQGSLREVMGRAPVEAMACGCPAVLPDIPAFRQMVPSARRFAVGDAAGLARALAEPLPDREAVRREFEERWSFAAIAARAEEVYTSVQEARRAGGKPGRPARSHATSSA